MHKILIATLAAGVMAAGVAQSASTTTASFQVTASVQATCSASAATLAFGNYTPGGGALTGNSNITVKCTKGTAFTVALNAGSTTGDTFAQRVMANGAATSTLQYNLYTTSALASVFGDGSAGTATVGGTGAGVTTANAVTVPVFGSLPDSAANQAALVGGYTDTIAVTVSY
jgi:spore coat protein U-like protein